MTQSAAYKQLAEIIKSVIANCDSDIERSEARAIIGAMLDELLVDVTKELNP